MGTCWGPKRIQKSNTFAPPSFTQPPEEKQTEYIECMLQFLIDEQNFYSQTVFITSLAKANGRGIVGDIYSEVAELLTLQ